MGALSRRAVERSAAYGGFRSPFDREWLVEEISRLSPAGASRVLLGAHTTEEEARNIEPTVRIVHLAILAYLNSRLPLNSALVLSLPENFPADLENGLLQAWETFQHLRLEADLIVLSACETVLDGDRDGDGLIGLTPAFQHAAARTVVASL